MEMGINGHKPHPPAQVLKRRYGDCKDKALLLVSLLRATGIEAAPALANTRERAALDGFLPTAYAFNHAIVRARIDGKERWLDATLTSQRGELSALSTPGYERALVLDPATYGALQAAAAGLVQAAALHRGGGARPRPRRPGAHGGWSRPTWASRPTRSAPCWWATPIAWASATSTSTGRTSRTSSSGRLPVLHDEPQKDQLVVTESYGIPAY